MQNITSRKNELGKTIKKIDEFKEGFSYEFRIRSKIYDKLLRQADKKAKELINLTY